MPTKDDTKQTDDIMDDERSGRNRISICRSCSHWHGIGTCVATSAAYRKVLTWTETWSESLAGYVL